MKRIIAFTVISLALLSVAQAHPRYHHYRHYAHVRHVRGAGAIVSLGAGLAHQLDSVQGWLGFPAFPIQPQPVSLPRYERGEVVGHPAGCPYRAFCGCGVSVRVFGHSVRSLWLAANWYAFPRAMAAAGMVAIFGKHHVAYIENVNGDGTATLYDPNSGGHLTRVHRASIRYATIVNPNRAY